LKDNNLSAIETMIVIPEDGCRGIDDANTKLIEKEMAMKSKTDCLLLLMPAMMFETAASIM